MSYKTISTKYITIFFGAFLIGGLLRVALYAWREEDRMGSIECGKLANFAVLDKDFLEDDINTIPDGKVVATIVDGNVVYTA